MSETEREHFDRLAAEQGEVWWGCKTHAGQMRFRRRAEMILQSVAEHPDPHLLDVGCGTGTFTRFLLERRPNLRLTACDIAPKAIELARHRYAAFPRARFEVADIYQLVYPAATFDAVVGNGVLHHLNLERALPELLRVLKPGGLLWFAEPNMLNPQMALEKNVRWIGRLSQASADETAFFRWPLARLLVGCGFMDVRVQPFDFLHPLVPPSLAGFVDKLGRGLERIPLLCEIAGSLLITAHKP